MELKRYPIPTRYGVFSLEVSQKGIYRLQFPKKKYENLKADSDGNALVHRARRLLHAYLDGKHVHFRHLKIDWSGLSPFEKQVLKKLSRVHYGGKCSYQDLAKKAGSPRSARAVGSAMRKNRLPIVLPCHRVLASNGGLGGYSQGLTWKKRLLSLESSSKST